MKNFTHHILIPSAAIIAGCATTINGSIEAIPDPFYKLEKNDPIVIVANPKSQNPILAKYYFFGAAEIFKKNGFNFILNEEGAKNSPRPPKLVVFVDVSKKTSSYAYQSADYGTVQKGSQTNCNSYGYGTTSTANCTTTPITSYEIVGYSTKTGYTTGHFFNLIAMDIESKKQVFYVISSSFNSSCSDENTYRLLASQSIQRINLSQPIKQSFTLKLPKGYPCE